MVDAVIKMYEKLAKIKGNTPADKGLRAVIEDDIKRVEKKDTLKEGSKYGKS